MNYFGASVYAQRPAGVATYSAGMWGGARCGVALRSFLSELGCLPVSAMLQLPTAWKKGTFADDATDDANEGDEGNRLNPDGVPSKALDRMLEQLEWHAHAMRAMRTMSTIGRDKRGT